jgi:hypothetical protein
MNDGATSNQPRLSALLLAAVILLCVSGCKGKPGDHCDASQPAVCEDRTHAIACQGGALVRASCKGPSGCAQAGQSIDCDDSLSVEGEACLQGDHENRACGADKKQSLLCTAGKWRAVQMCTGPAGCGINGDAVTCDARGAAAGDPCPGPGTFACAADGRSRLTCRDGKFTFDRFCKGQAGCRDHDVSCDQSVSDVGDPCGVPGTLACRSDGVSELLCQGGQYVPKRQCSGTGCQAMAHGRIECPQ